MERILRCIKQASIFLCNAENYLGEGDELPLQFLVYQLSKDMSISYRVLDIRGLGLNDEVVSNLSYSPGHVKYNGSGGRSFL